MEWICGLAAALVFSELFVVNIGRSMPLILAVAIGIPVLMATLRKSFPDEERGVRNAGMLAMGFAPPGIPTPAKLQPVWSGLPMPELDKESEYTQLGLDAVIHVESENIYVKEVEQ